jgi:hypothetical protein
VSFTVSVGQELTHANIPLDTVHNRNKPAQIHGLLGLQTFIITLYKHTFRKMSLNDSVLPENILNEAEKALNSLIPEKSKGRYYLKS